MSLLYGIKSIQQGAGANIPHIFGFATPRTAPNDSLLEAWNDGTGAAKRLVLDLNGNLTIAGGLIAAGASAIGGSTCYAIYTGLGLVRFGGGTTISVGAANVNALIVLGTQAGTTYQVLFGYDGNNCWGSLTDATGATTLRAFGAGAAFTFYNDFGPQNNAKLVFLDTGGGKGYFVAQNDNNFVCFTTDAAGASQPLWSRVMRQNIGSAQMVVYEDLDLDNGRAFQIGGTQVVRARVTGYTAMTGSPDKATAYATGTVTLAQLAGRVAQLQADITTHGLIGA
jgi:hypothetical protein